MKLKNYILVVGILSLVGSIKPMEEEAVLQKPAEIDLVEEIVEEELPYIKKVKNGCFNQRRSIIGVTSALIYTAFSYWYPETSLVAPLTVGALAYGSAHFIKKSDSDSQAVRRIAADVSEVVNRPGPRGGLKGLLHEFGKDVIGGGGEGLRENLTEPTIDRIVAKVDDLAPRITEVKEGYTDIKKLFKRAVYAVPLVIGIWYAGAILKNQTEAYLNTPYLDVQIMGAENSKACGRTARKMIFSDTTSKKLREVFEGTRNAKIKDDYFKNVLLYGPPKSGKRMFADQLALYAQMDYCEIPWTALSKGKDGVALDNFFKKEVKKSKNGVVIYIDNAQMLFSSLSNNLSTGMNSVINTIIEHTEKQSKQYIVVFGIPEKPILNNYNTSVIDPYRIIEITHPALTERVKLLKLYRDLYFDKLDEEVQAVLSDKGVQHLAQVLDRASAAELAGFMNTLRNNSELPTSDGLKAVFDSLVKSSKQQYDDYVSNNPLSI